MSNAQDDFEPNSFIMGYIPLHISLSVLTFLAVSGKTSETNSEQNAGIKSTDETVFTEIPEQKVALMKVIFKNVEEERIKESFLEVLRRYETLHGYEITLEQKNVKRSTMQAQPILGIRGLFGGVKKYKIILATYVKDSEDRVDELSSDVLTGWFAHELGHLVDYERYSQMGMMRFGVRYLTSKKFKKAAEYSADMIAVEKGFHQEIIAAKRYILDHEFLTENYKSNIRRYYMSVEDVEMCLGDQPAVEPK